MSTQNAKNLFLSKFNRNVSGLTIALIGCLIISHFVLDGYYHHTRYEILTYGTIIFLYALALNFLVGKSDPHGNPFQSYNTKYWYLAIFILYGSYLFNFWLKLAIFSVPQPFNVDLWINRNLQGFFAVVYLIATVYNLRAYTKTRLIDFLWITIALTGLVIELGVIVYYYIYPETWAKTNAVVIFWRIITFGVATSYLGFLLMAVYLTWNKFGNTLSRIFVVIGIGFYATLMVMMFSLNMADFTPGGDNDITYIVANIYGLFVGILMLIAWSRVDPIVIRRNYIFLKNSFVLIGIHTILFAINNVYKTVSAGYFDFVPRVEYAWFPYVNILITITYTTLNASLVLVIVLFFDDFLYVSKPQIARVMRNIVDVVSSKKFSDLANAELMLKKLERNTTTIEEIKATIDYRFYQLQFLLLQYSFDKSDETYAKTKKVLDEYLLLASNSKHPEDIIRSHIVSAKFSLLEGNLVEGREILLKAEQICKEYGFIELMHTVHKEIQTLDNEFVKWEGLVSQNRAFSEKLKTSNVISYLEKVLSSPKYPEISSD